MVGRAIKVLLGLLQIDFFSFWGGFLAVALGVPDLDVIDRADHHGILLQTGFAAQPFRNE